MVQHWIKYEGHNYHSPMQRASSGRLLDCGRGIASRTWSGGRRMTTQMIERMAVELDGQGTPVILVHGLGGTSNFYTPQAAALAERYWTIRPDLPGSGRSPAWEQTTIQSFVDALVRLLGR